MAARRPSAGVWPGTGSGSRSSPESSSSTRPRATSSSSERAIAARRSSTASSTRSSGPSLALGIAAYRYHRIRFPDAWSYPGALVNSVVTALIDEVTFRGAIFGILLMTDMNPTAANAIQALLYALATRLGAPGRNRYMLAMALVIGLTGGWVTGVTGGIAAAFLGHAVTRFAVFLCTGHAGQFLPRGREEEEIDKRRRTPDGWRVIGHQESAPPDR